MCSPNTYLLATPCFAVDKLGFKVQGSSIQPYKGTTVYNIKRLRMVGSARTHGWFSMDFELTPLVLSSMFFFEPKIAFGIYGSEQT